jgi:hypothetical protein
MHERHEIELSRDADVTFSAAGEPEQGFYRCHDNLDDIHEKDLIPDLAPKLLRQKRSKAAEDLSVMAEDSTEATRRRLSLDSGRGGSVLAEDEDLASEAATLEAESPRSRASSMSSGIGSMQGSCSTLPPRGTRCPETETAGKDDKDIFFFDEAASYLSSSCLTFATCQPLRPTSRKVSSRENGDKKEVPLESCAQTKLSTHPNRDLDEGASFAASTGRESEGAAVVSPPPPLPPRNYLHKKVAGQPASARRRAAASKDVAQTVEALQQVSEDLLSLIHGQKLFRPRSTPRPRLPSPPAAVEAISSDGHFRFRQSELSDDLDDLLVRSATLPCKRTLDFLDASLLADKEDKSINNNNSIGLADAADTGAPLLFVDDNDENAAPRRLSSRRRRTSIRFRNPLQPPPPQPPRRTSDVASRRSPVLTSPTTKPTKRRRTLFQLASPFSAKKTSAKLRRTSDAPKPSVAAAVGGDDDEVRLPIVLDERGKRDVEEAIREGLPVIPFFQTPKAVHVGRSEAPHRLQSGSLTVAALATPMASRKLISGRLEDHLVFLPPRSRDLLPVMDGGYFAMKSPVCHGRHCQSCTCQVSPKLVFTQDNSDYVMMEAQTPNI